MSLFQQSTDKTKGTRTQVLCAGAVAGLVSRFCIAPLDVLKIRLQLQYHSLADPLSTPLGKTPAGVLHLAREIFRHEGITGFWKGNIPAEGLYLSYGAAQFLAYRSANQVLESLERRENVKIPGTIKSFLAGAVAAQGTEKVYAGLIASIRDITRLEGPAGFFRGLPAGIAQIVPNMGLFFAFYEGFKPIAADIHLPFGSGDALAGISASILSKSAVFPLDTVRKRLQVQGPTRGKYFGGAKMPVYQGVRGTIGMIVKREGWRGLYRGLGVSLIKAAPASAVTMWTYERALGLIQGLGERGDGSG
ncbi:mitochondrial thiamine pyrophosphate transporter [Elasticomyces elasticus]|nr:mitochondrial thiamine pyrophosphate transporter [Elasticomyces elasticus]KAK5768645.1 mitochondrial thiamine pyrophosphate transporter [Elasticomyces elasticus]